MTCLILIVALTLVTTAPKPSWLLGELTAQTQNFENSSVRSSWTNLSKGRPTRWEDQHFYKDDLGRFRITTTTGAFDDAGNRTRDPRVSDETVRVFDGEKTVTKNFYIDKDRLGRSVEIGSRSSGYRSAQVHDGEFPKGGISSVRSPLTYVCNEVVFGLTESLEAGRDILIVPSDEVKGLFELTLKRTPGHEVLGSDRVRALLDPAKGWLPIRVDSVDKNNRLIRRTVCEYERSDNGTWIPRHGSTQHFAKRHVDEGPLWETRFEAEKIVLNDPNFDDSVFQVTLDPDTAVSDIRYGVKFRVGDEEVMDHELTRLSKQALELEYQETMQRTYGVDVNQPAGWRSWIIGVSLAAIPSILVVLVLRKYFSSRAAA